MAILSFNGRTNIAIRIVTQAYPDAKLLESEGIALNGPTTNPSDINRLKVVFSGGPGTIIIEEVAYGEFGAPVTTTQPWLGDVVIKWPVEIDLDRANQLKVAAGFTAPYAAVTLRTPLGPKRLNPLFIFATPNRGEYVFVDTITGAVTDGS